AQVGRDQQLPLATGLHAGDALVPTLDDLTLTDLERERLAAVLGAVELRTLLVVLPQPAGVMHHAGLAGLGLLPGPFLDIAVLELTVGFRHLLGLLLVRLALGRSVKGNQPRNGHCGEEDRAQRLGRGLHRGWNSLWFCDNRAIPAPSGQSLTLTKIGANREEPGRDQASRPRDTALLHEFQI